MKKTLLAFSVFCISIMLLAQPVPVKIGDQCPDFTITNFINARFEKISIAALKGKLIILDFWSSNCHGCIKALPRMDSLQKKFKDKLAIIVITAQAKENTKKFWSANKVTRTIDLPLAVEDTLLHRYFPHRYIPHEIWIDGNGKVIAITDEEYVTAANIETVLVGKKASWLEKKEIKDYDYSRPLYKMMEEEIGPAADLTYSMLTRNINGVRIYKEVTADTLANRKRILLLNFPVIGLYETALKMMGWDQLKYRIQLNVKDSTRYFYNMRSGYRSEWEDKNRYCYEAVYPFKTSDDKIAQNTIKDINRFLDLNGQFEKKRVSCYVLVNSFPSEKSVPLPNGMPVIKIESTQKLAVEISHNLNSLVLDETCGVVGNMLISPVTFSDIGRLRQKIREYGFDLVKTVREIEVFVIQDIE